jgi:hypothetical protein
MHNEKIEQRCQDRQPFLGHNQGRERRLSQENSRLHPLIASPTREYNLYIYQTGHAKDVHS